MRQIVPDPHRHVWLSAALLLLIASGVGCATGRAAKGPEMPVLDPPPAPPRVVTPAVVDATLTAPQVVVEEETPTARTPARPVPARSDPPKPALPRAERESDREPRSPKRRAEPNPANTSLGGGIRGRHQRPVARAEGELQRVDYRTHSR